MSRLKPPPTAGGAPSDAVLEKVRIPFVQRGDLIEDGKGRRVFLVDLGLLGSFVELSDPPAIGERAELVFRLPGNDIPVIVGCRVAWRHAEGEKPAPLPAGAGLEFVYVSPADRERLRAHLLEHLRSARGARRFARPWPPGGSD